MSDSDETKPKAPQTHPDAWAAWGRALVNVGSKRGDLAMVREGKALEKQLRAGLTPYSDSKPSSE